MDVRLVLETLGEPQSAGAVEPYWDRTLSSPRMPDGKRFPSARRIRSWREWCGFESDLDEVLLRTALIIKRDKKLKLLFLHLVRRLAVYPEPSCEAFNGWPKLEKVLGKDSGVFYLLAGLSIVPLVLSRHAAMNVHETITRDTLLQLYSFCDNYRKDHDGRPGLLLRQFFWLSYYIDGSLFRLGRFEYKLEKNPACLRVFKHKKSGEIRAFLPPGNIICPDGFLARSGTMVEDIHASQLSEFISTPEYIQANPVLPDGRISAVPVKLPLDDWDLVLGPEDYVLDMHIPSGGSMDLDACKESFLKAIDFFTAHFSERKPKAFYCVSWIFNPALRTILPENANLVRLLRSVHLFPVATDEKDGLFFIFGEQDDFSRMPRKTSLQKSVWDYIQAGNTWRGGGMFLLFDEAEQLEPGNNW